MEFRVLGSLEVWREGELVDIGSSNERKVLAALLVDANAVVSTSRLIDILWGDEPPASDRNALQTYIARLRRRLRTDEEQSPIVTRPPGYAIELGPEELDVLQFRELVGRARKEPGRSLELLDAALALWRGPAFAEFADDDVARAEAASLDELRQTVIEDRVEVLLALDRATDAASVLEGVVAAHPLRERPHAQLMRALARAGRQVEALRLYQRLRERLADELGLEPSPALRALESEILDHAPNVAPADVESPPPSRPGNVAPPITTFVGRGEELTQIVDLLARARVLSLVGVGGVGKSRLALRVAETAAGSFPDGTWIVELARVSAPDAVPHAVAVALGLTPPAGADVSDALVELLRSRQLLLVVDNCEHVLHAAASLAELLARRCAGITIVATSRERLGVSGEHVWPVLPLPVPPPGASVGDVEASPAVALFVDRARAARADFSLDVTTVDAVVEVCRGLDGLPLALEIAAARVGVLSATDLANRLRDRFALLTSGPRGEGERHRTLRALVDWSYGLLDETERAVFDRLSVFAGGWTLDAAVAVCADSRIAASEVTAIVVGLAEKSMVVPPSPTGDGRYGMLETLRLYGTERLEARGEKDATAESHARHFVAVAEEAEHGLRSRDERAWVGRLRAEVDNLRSAHAWSRAQPVPDLALRLSAALHRFATWQANDEILAWAEAVAELDSAAGRPLLPVVLGSAAVRHMHRGEVSDVRRLAERALEACEGPEDPRRALPIEALASMSLLSGRLDEAFEHYGDAAQRWEAAGDLAGAVWCLCGRGVAAANRGDLDAAVASTARARAIAKSAHNPTMMANIYYSEAESLLEVDPARALEPFEAALASAEAADNAFMRGIALVSNTSLRSRVGDPIVALRMFSDVITHWRRGGSWTQQMLTLRNLVELLARLGAHERAAVLYGACAASATAPPRYGAEAERLAQVMRTLVGTIGDDGLREATSRGAMLSEDEAVDFAIATIRSLLPAD